MCYHYTNVTEKILLAARIELALHYAKALKAPGFPFSQASKYVGLTTQQSISPAELESTTLSLEDSRNIPIMLRGQRRTFNVRTDNAHGEIRTRDLHVISMALLTTELRVLIFATRIERVTFRTTAECSTS